MIPIHGYSFRYVEENVIWPHDSEYHCKIYRKFPEGPSPQGIFLIDKIGQIKFFYESIKDFCIASGLTESAVRYRIQVNSPWKNFHIKNFDPKQPFSPFTE